MPYDITSAPSLSVFRSLQVSRLLCFVAHAQTYSSDIYFPHSTFSYFSVVWSQKYLPYLGHVKRLCGFVNLMIMVMMKMNTI